MKFLKPRNKAINQISRTQITINCACCMWCNPLEKLGRWLIYLFPRPPWTCSWSSMTINGFAFSTNSDSLPHFGIWVSFKISSCEVFSILLIYFGGNLSLIWLVSHIFLKLHFLWLFYIRQNLMCLLIYSVLIFAWNLLLECFILDVSWKIRTLKLNGLEYLHFTASS